MKCLILIRRIVYCNYATFGIGLEASQPAQDYSHGQCSHPYLLLVGLNTSSGPPCSFLSQNRTLGIQLACMCVGFRKKNKVSSFSSSLKGICRRGRSHGVPNMNHGNQFTRRSQPASYEPRTARKIPLMCSFSGNCAASVPISTCMCL